MTKETKPMYTTIEKVLKKELERTRNENRELKFQLLALQSKIEKQSKA